jgi:hypothetical protein
MLNANAVASAFIAEIISLKGRYNIAVALIAQLDRADPS